MHFKKIARYIELKISEIEFSLLLCCLKQTFFGSFDELKMHQLRQHITIRKSKHML